MIFTNEKKYEFLHCFKNYLNYFFNDYNNDVISKNLFLHKKDFLVNSYSNVRLDLKNKGNENNNIKIMETNNDLNFFAPSWFTNETGVGYQVETNSNNIFLKFKCINNGNLFFSFRGIDYRDSDKKLRAYLVLNSFKINGDFILSDSQLIWHDEPFEYTYSCKDEEIITVEIGCTYVFDTFPELIEIINDFNIPHKSYEAIMKNFNRYCNTKLKEIISKQSKKIESKRNVKNVAIYGSCISKDPFTTFFNESYKDRYNCIFTDQKHSFISTMQKHFEVDDSELLLLPDNYDVRYFSKCIKDDIEKTFITNIITNDIDYLVIDVNFDVEQGVIKFNNDIYLSFIKNMDQTQFFKNLENIEYINLFNNKEEYFNLWKKYCDKFFNFIKTNCPNVKIVLAEVRGVSIVERFDKSRYEDPFFKERVGLVNPLFKMLEDYIKENFDVYVINFDKHTVLKENHRWGKFYVHYTDEYYVNFLEKMNNIIIYDELKTENKELNDRLDKLEDKIQNF